MYVWSCSVAAYWGIRRGEYDVREYLPVHHSTRANVSCIVVGNYSVGFNCSYVACEAFVISCFDDVVGVAEEVFVYVVCVSEGVEGIVAKCVNDEGAVSEYLEEWCRFMHVYG